MTPTRFRSPVAAERFPEQRGKVILAGEPVEFAPHWLFPGELLPLLPERGLSFGEGRLG